MSYYCCQIDVPSPAYDEAFEIRRKILRTPLNLTFEIEDVLGDYLEFHFGIFTILDEMAGTVILKPLDPGKTLKLRQMAILEQYQGQQFGTQLIRFIEQWVKSNGYQKLELNARSTAIGFYEKLGYQVEGNEFLEVNIPHKKMYKFFDPNE